MDNLDRKIGRFFFARAQLSLFGCAFALAFPACVVQDSDPEVGPLPGTSAGGSFPGGSSGPGSGTPGGSGGTGGGGGTTQEPGVPVDFLTPDPGEAGGGDGGGFPGGDKKDGGGDDEEEKEDEDSGDSPKDEGPNPGAKILAEADVLHLEGDHAYVLSRHSGFHLLDLQNPAQIKILGSFALDGEPFEMYVKDQEVVVMVRGQFLYDEKDKRWKPTSAVVRLSAAMPSQIRRVDEARVLGRISDSRMNEGRLYVVSHENGRCFGCDTDSRIRLSSIAARKGAALTMLDSEAFVQSERLWREPSAYFRNDNVYIAQPQRGVGEGQKGQILRARIDASTGMLSQQSPLVVDGRILSRWQMNEHKGVLRVFSQAPRRDIPPMLETFDLGQATAPRLAGLKVVLPEPEDIKSARFDEDRAYLITFRRTDPLFTFDLRNPKAPRQLGELEIPGWVYHLEPRGNRLLGAGYNVGVKENRLSLTLFNVENLARPSVLSRVDFGGISADFAEGQNQIHKSIRVLKDKNLVLIPYITRGRPGGDDGIEPGFPGWSEAQSHGSKRRECPETQKSAVALFDWKADRLVTRGVAPIEGAAHRSFLHRDRLFSLSDDAIASYNIDDRSAPVQLDHQELAMDAQHLVNMGANTLRVSGQWWSGARRLQVVASDKVGKPEVISEISLGQLDDKACDDGRDVQVREIFVHRQHAYIFYHTWFSSYKHLKVAVVNVADPRALKVLGNAQVRRPGRASTQRLGKTSIRSLNVGAVGDRVVVASVDMVFNKGAEDRSRDTTFSVLRIDPVQGVVNELELPRKQTHYAGGLIAAGDELGSWHARNTNVPGKLRFFYDRFYVDTQGKFRHQAVNVPGVPLGFDDVHKRLFSVNFTITPSALDPVACAAHVKFHEWDWAQGQCLLLSTSLAELSLGVDGKATLVASHDVAGPDLALVSAFFHEGRVVGYAGRAAKDERPGSRVLGGLDAAAAFQLARFEQPSPKSVSPLNGAQVMVQTGLRDISVYDMRQVANIQARSYEAPFRWCTSAQILGTQLQCALGRYGVRTLSPK